MNFSKNSQSKILTTGDIVKKSTDIKPATTRRQNVVNNVCCRNKRKSSEGWYEEQKSDEGIWDL
ncbi:MAG: hypothetical protein ACQEWV_15700 [Bacillota bacterium]